MKEQALSWRQIQLQNITNKSSLVEFLELDAEKRAKILSSSPFRLNLPLRLAKKIQKNCLTDPLFKQFVPLKEEEFLCSNFSHDPLQEMDACLEKKLLKKYDKRALLLTTSACAMHCRFCFRKNFPYETKEAGFEKEIALIQKDPSIHEIILSGGDPLSLSDTKLEILLTKLDQINHIKKIRFHTRFPIGIPERLDEKFLSILKNINVQVFFVLHINHPKELDEDIFKALQNLQKLGIPLLCQTVLLQGINDTLETLVKLSESLTNHGIIPYYLHQLDQVQGSKHFEVLEDKGASLIQGLQSQLSGYGVFKYVKEEPETKSKTSISP